jgi:hypothetical protein
MSKEQLGRVRIEKEAKADRRDTADERTKFSRNPHARDNVNVPQGPRVGMEGAHKAKRSNFLDAKAERQPLADMVTGAFAGRAAELEKNPGQHEVPESGAIKSNSQVDRFKAKRSKYKD